MREQLRIGMLSGLLGRKRVGAGPVSMSLRDVTLVCFGCMVGYLVSLSPAVHFTAQPTLVLPHKLRWKMSKVVTSQSGAADAADGENREAGPPTGSDDRGESPALPQPPPASNLDAAALVAPPAAGPETLHLFLAWVGRSKPPFPELQRVLMDVVHQTAASRPVMLHMMVEDSAGAAGDAQLGAAFAALAAAGSPRGVVFRHALYDFREFKARSKYYVDLCNDFQGNIANADAKEYACQFLIKPLLWEIIPPEAGARWVVAVDTDLRIAGDFADVIGEHAGAMEARGAIFGLSAEQQPTYSFNSPQSARGFNGGVQVIDLHAMRANAGYHELLRVFHWTDTDPRWRPATDLGDQTLYSIFNFSHPEMFVEMGCHWNRQLCRAWFIIFNERTPPESLLQYEREALCTGQEIRVLHGNCRSQRPGSEELEGLPDTWRERNAAAERIMAESYAAMEGRVRGTAGKAAAR